MRRWLTDCSFPAAKIFSNALLQRHDITALIRDTEAHERALFSVPASQASVASHAAARSTRRDTVFDLAAARDGLLGGRGVGGRVPRRKTAVAAVLGGDMMRQIRDGGGDGPGKERGEVDVGTLLDGAEKLCQV